MFRRYPTKYNSRKIEIDGHKFPSKLEAKRYLELKQLLEEGKNKGFGAAKGVHPHPFLQEEWQDIS